MFNASSIIYKYRETDRRSVHLKRSKCINEKRVPTLGREQLVGKSMMTKLKESRELKNKKTKNKKIGTEISFL